MRQGRALYRYPSAAYRRISVATNAAGDIARAHREPNSQTACWNSRRDLAYYFHCRISRRNRWGVRMPSRFHSAESIRTLGDIQIFEERELTRFENARPNS